MLFFGGCNFGFWEVFGDCVMLLRIRMIGWLGILEYNALELIVDFPPTSKIFRML
jgi:hypothetical protein